MPLFAVLAWAAWRPTALALVVRFPVRRLAARADPGQLLTFLMVFAALKFTVALLILKWMPLRLALTPAATKHRRVRRRAVAVFKAAAERRTDGRTGILIYLSMAERRAEIVADEAILKVTDDANLGRGDGGVARRGAARAGPATASSRRSSGSARCSPSISRARPTTSTKSRTS